MAEASVAFLITKAASVLGAEALKFASSVVSEEAARVRQLHSKLGEIMMEFKLMQAFLRQLDVQGEMKGVGAAWAEQVREAALEVEDIIDEYTYLMGSHDGRGILGFVRKAISHTLRASSWHDITDRLEGIESRLQRLTRMKERYSIKIVEGGATPIHEAERWKHVSPHLIGHDDFVGMEEDKSTLLSWLTGQQSRHQLISVWGMGGLGKTTLVTKIFKSVKGHFDIHAWVSVSETYTVDDLLKKILRQFLDKGETKDNCKPMIDNMSHNSLIEALQEQSKGKRYLLVLDDVWSTGVWRDVSDALISGDCRSRIIFTTRMREVALLGNHVMELQPLGENDSWALFCKKAFCNNINGDSTCPLHLEKWAKAILDKCGGLPLAIVALGSLLSLRVKEELEWKRVYDDINWLLINSPQLEPLKNILFLSFKNLPTYLKHCFLYCSVFPEDYSITRKRLIRLWVAEGLVESRGRLTLEEVAEDNIYQLIYRGMLQLEERNVFGRVKSCRMHDMMREVALQISKGEKFCSVHDNTEETLYANTRRLSVHKTPQDVRKDEAWISRLRSFLLFDGDSFSAPLLFNNLLSCFKLLRVLDLSGAPIDSVPEEVYHLFNLRYLSLRRTKIKELSESLGRLGNLETLDLKNTTVKKLPRAVTKLKKLRHLYLAFYGHRSSDTYSYFSGTKAPKGLWDLTDLQTIHVVEASDEFVRHARNLVKLRSFRIMKVRAVHCAPLCVSVSQMVQLHTLGITAVDEDGEMLELDTMSSPPQYLRTLFLLGRLKNDVLPHWFCSLRNLRTLVLYWSRLQGDPLPFLNESLPNLVLLELTKAYEGRGLLFQAGWFPELKRLWLINMPLKRIEIEEGSMAGLERLYLRACRELKEVPKGVEHLTALQLFYVREMADELVEQHLLLEVGGFSCRIDDSTAELMIQPADDGIEQGDSANEVTRE